MDKIKLIIVMLLWGSIGLFTRYIDLTPMQLSFTRAIIAIPILFLLIKDKKNILKLNKESVVLYAIAGIFIGGAWVSLFYGYQYTTIASAVIIYNMCPVYVMILAPLLLKEKISLIQIAVIIVSFIGLILIVWNSKNGDTDIVGMLFSAASGICYAIVVIINRKIRVKIESNTATFIQMCSVMIVMLPFIIVDGIGSDVQALNSTAIVLLLVLAIIHTGIAYSVYFSTYHHMKSIDIVIFSYLEPVFGILFSVLFLAETMTLLQWLGAILILGSTFIGEKAKAGK